MNDVTSLHHRRAADRWNRVSVGDLLERLTWSTPDKDALISGPGACAYPEHERLTYREADRLANRIANALLGQGLQRGDRVATVCENSVEAFLTKIGIAKAGLVCAPINPTLAPDVIAYLIRHVEAGFAVVDAELWPRVEASFAEAGLSPGVTIPIGGGTIGGSTSFAEFVADAPDTEPDVEIHADDIWELLFTSGTTAMPKAVMISHNYSYMAGYSFALTLTRGLRFESDLRLCSFLPVIYHSGDQIFALSVFLAGGTLVLGRKPAADRIAATIAEEGITALWGGSPAMIDAVAGALDGGSTDPSASSLGVVVYGWAALSPATVDSLKRLCGPDLLPVEIFGQTEAISCHRFWVDKWRDTFLRTAPEQNYVGVPNPVLASKVVDETGEEVEPGIAGEAVYRSPAVFSGYFRDETATREAFRDGWFHSGDSCTYDEDGLRVMIDRYKDIVKSGGENVSSMRVEAVLLQHPEVLRAAVVGLVHPRWGEAVTAFVVPADGQDVDESSVIAFCRERLAGFETPKKVVAVEALPETVGGKVLKYKLRKAHADLYA